MFTITAITHSNQTTISNIEISEDRVSGLVRHLMASPQVRKVHAYQVEDLHMDTNQALEAIISDIDGLLSE